MNVYHNSFYGMGSRFNAVLPHEDEEVCERLFHVIKNEVIRIERKLSYFNPHSEISRINREAFQKPMGLDEEVFGIIQTCIEYSELTGGAYDITMRPVIESINKKNDTSVTHGSYIKDIVLDKENRSVFFNSDQVKIDFGGYGKGYALEKIKKLLEGSPVKHAFISFGESSIYVRGQHPGGKKWNVGIKDFNDSDNSLFVFEISDQSISSSSNYYSDDIGQVHKKVNIINPFTLQPADELSIVSVKSASPAEAEILSTAFFVMDDDRVQQIISGSEGLEAVRIKFTEGEPVIKHFIQDI